MMFSYWPIVFSKWETVSTLVKWCKIVFLNKWQNNCYCPIGKIYNKFTNWIDETCIRFFIWVLLQSISIEIPCMSARVTLSPNRFKQVRKQVNSISNLLLAESLFTLFQGDNFPIFQNLTLPGYWRTLWYLNCSSKTRYWKGWERILSHCCKE